MNRKKEQPIKSKIHFKIASFQDFWYAAFSSFLWVLKEQLHNYFTHKLLCVFFLNDNFILQLRYSLIQSTAVLSDFFQLL